MRVSFQSAFMNCHRHTNRGTTIHSADCLPPTAKAYPPVQNASIRGLTQFQPLTYNQGLSNNSREAAGFAIPPNRPDSGISRGAGSEKGRPQPDRAVKGAALESFFAEKSRNGKIIVCEATGVLVRYAAYCDEPFWSQKELGQGQIQNNKQLLITMPTLPADEARECSWFSRRKDAAGFENLLCIGVPPAAGRFVRVLAQGAARLPGILIGDGFPKC